jgi:hypothetical protein
VDAQEVRQFPACTITQVMFEHNVQDLNGSLVVLRMAVRSYPVGSAIQ